MGSKDDVIAAVLLYLSVMLTVLSEKSFFPDASDMLDHGLQRMSSLDYGLNLLITGPSM